MELELLPTGAAAAWAGVPTAVKTALTRKYNQVRLTRVTPPPNPPHCTPLHTHQTHAPNLPPP